MRDAPMHRCIDASMHRRSLEENASSKYNERDEKRMPIHPVGGLRRKPIASFLPPQQQQQQQGGKTLGEGGQGRVNTLDELSFKGGAAYELLALDPAGGRIYEVAVVRSLSELADLLGVGVLELVASAVYKVGAEPGDGDDEVRRTEAMVAAVAATPPPTADDALLLPPTPPPLSTLLRFTTLLPMQNEQGMGKGKGKGGKGPHVALALRRVQQQQQQQQQQHDNAKAAAKHRSKRSSPKLFAGGFGGLPPPPREYYPLYRRMDGNLYEVRKMLTLHTKLRAVDAVLSALAVLRAAGAHHGDIKDENVLWRAPYAFAPGSAGSGTSDVEFVLSDFGHVKVKPTTSPHMRGTPGFMSPMLYYPTNAAKFYSNTSALGLPQGPLDMHDVWRTYDVATAPAAPTAPTASAAPAAAAPHAKDDGGQTGLSPTEQFEKNDLYALGVMLAEHLDDKADVAAVAFARALVSGDRKAGIWTVRDARASLKRLLEAKAATARRTTGRRGASKRTLGNTQVGKPNSKTKTKTPVTNTKTKPGM